MIITTTPLIQGYDIVTYHGLLSANQVIGANFFSDLFAGITDTLGGFSGSYRSQLDELYNDIINTITSKAEAIGANAIIGLHVDFDEISGKGKSMFMVTAIGTAVSIKPVYNRYEVFKKLHELKVYFDDGFMTPEEYEREVKLIKAFNRNEIEEDSFRLQQESKEYAEKQALIAKEYAERQALKEEFEKQQEEALKKAKAKQEAEQIEREKKLNEINAIICKDFLPRRNEVENLSIIDIENASTDFSLPIEDMKPYDAIKYLISIGEPAMAGKFYTEKYHLSATDAKEYMLGIFNAIINPL